MFIVSIWGKGGDVHKYITNVPSHLIQNNKLWNLFPFFFNLSATANLHLAGDSFFPSCIVERS